MLFTRSPDPAKPNTSFGVLAVAQSATLKLLGVQFEEKLSFRAHIASTAVRASQRLGLLLCQSATTASYQFRSCSIQHQAGERIVDFCNRLKRAAVPRQFGDHLDRALKDQFVAGLASSDIKRKILTSADADTNQFADVVQIAEREESAITYVGQLTPGASSLDQSAHSSSVNKLHSTSKSRSSPNRTAPNRTADQRDRRSTTTTTPTRKCVRCTSDLHMASKCPHRNTECRFCKKIGHLERACLSKRKRAGQVNHVDDESESDENRGEIISDVPMFKIRSGNGQNPPYTVMAKINDSPLSTRLEIDTGSVVTIITKSDFEKLGSPITSLATATVRLIRFSGSSIPCLGERKFPVSINGQTHKDMLRIVDTKGPSLLGRDLLASFKLDWKEIVHVKSQIDDASRNNG
eukprot:scpid78022/ scgid31689/ 